MKFRKNGIIFLIILLFNGFFIVLLSFSNNSFLNSSPNLYKFNVIDGLNTFSTNNQSRISELPTYSETYDLNQNKLNKWEESILIADQNQNGINDGFEKVLNSLSKSGNSKENIYLDKILLSEKDFAARLLGEENDSLEKISKDFIPMIIQFPNEDFGSYSSLFENSGGKIKSTYNAAINGFAGSINYENFCQFYKLLKLTSIPFLIEEDKICKANLYYASRNMNLRPYTWNNLSYTGDNYGSIAVLDTGIDDSHNFFTPGYSNGNFNFKIVGWRDEVSGLSAPYDDNGHGSHCAGIATGKGSPAYDGSSRVVSTYSFGFDFSGYYLYDHIYYEFDGANFNVTKAGIVDIVCEFNDYTSGSDDVHIFTHLYYGETDVDNYTSYASSWSDTLSFTATNSTLGEYSLKYDLYIDDNTGDGIVISPHMRFRGIIHWPFDPPLMGSGDPWKGVAPDTHLVGVKVLDSTGSGWISDIVDGINWVITNKRNYNITTISLSIGGSPGDATFVNAVNNAVENGIVTVVAAGNGGGIGNNIGSPGDADNVITVAAMSYADRVTEYSSSGGSSYAGLTIKPDIMAPGGSAYDFSMFSTDTNDNDAEGEFNDGFSNDMTSMIGTSMATPAVAGATSLLIKAMGGHQNWNYTALEAKKVKALLLMTATETYPLTREIDTSFSPYLNRGGKDSHEGYGRLNIDAAIEAYTQKLNISSNKETWISSSSLSPFSKHAFGCYVDLIAGQNYNFHLLVPDGADYDLHLYNSNPTSIGEPIMEESSTSGILGRDETIIFDPKESGRYYLIAKAISGQGNATLIWNHTSLDDVRIGTVIAHGEINPRTAYQNITSELIQRGATVTDIISPINSSILSSYDVLWFDENGSAMTQNEIDNIKEWVRNGGNILITGDNMGSAVNLVQEFNIFYTSMVGSGMTNSVYPHPTTVSINEMNFPSPGCSLNISSQPNAYSCVKLNGYNLVVAVPYTNGKLVIITDEEVLLNYSLANNHIFINNTFSWFAFEESITPISDYNPLFLLFASPPSDYTLIILIVLFIVGAAIGLPFGVITYKRQYSLGTQKRRDTIPASERTQRQTERMYDNKESIVIQNKVSGIEIVKISDNEILELLKQDISKAEIPVEPTIIVVEKPEERIDQTAKNYFNKGIESFNLNDFQKAIDFFKKAVEIDPRYKEAWFEMGLIYSITDNVPKVIECYTKVTELDPRFKEAWDFLGSAYLASNNYQDALKSYKNVVEIDPLDINSWNSLGLIHYKSKNYQEAIECYKKMLEIHSNDKNAWYNMGKCYGLLGDYYKAIACYEKIIDINPLNKNAWSALGDSYANLGDDQKSLDCYTKAIQIDPKDNQVLTTINSLKNKISKEKDIVTISTSNIEDILEKDARSLYDIGNTFFNIGDYQIAIEYYEKVLSIAPKFKEVWSNMGEAYARLGNLQKMVECKKKALE